MLIYLSLILLIFFQSFPSLLNATKWNKSLTIIFFIELSIILCFKSYTVGPDSISYYGMFSYIINNPIYTINLEKGFVLFNKFLGCISNEPQVIFIATGLIISYSICQLIYKKSTIIWLSIIIYLTIGLFSFNLSGLRQSIAISICIFSYSFILQRNFVLFLLIVLFASSFHHSAISFLIAYPLYNLKIDRKTLIISAFIALFVLVFSKYFINSILQLFPSYQDYLDTESRFGRNIIGGDVRVASIFKTGINFAVFSFSLLLWNKIKDIKNTCYSIYMEMKLLILFSLVATIIMFSSINATVFERVAMYFNAFYIILIPKIISYIEDKNIKILSIIFVVSFCLLYAIIVSIYRPEWNSFLDYSFFW